MKSGKQRNDDYWKAADCLLLTKYKLHDQDFLKRERNVCYILMKLFRLSLSALTTVMFQAHSNK